MKRIIKGCLIGAGIIAILWFCAPLLIGLMFEVSSRHQYNADPPHKVKSIIVTNTDISVTLWRKQRPRAICYEGEYRVVEITRPNHVSQFYQILSTSAGDSQRLGLYWHPDKKLLRFRDDGMIDAPGESRVDLNAETVCHAWQQVSHETLLTKARKASDAFCFPTASGNESLSFTEPEDPPLSDAGVFLGLLEETEADNVNQQLSSTSDSSTRAGTDFGTPDK